MDINPLLESRDMSNYQPLCVTNPRGMKKVSTSENLPISIDSLKVCKINSGKILPNDTYDRCDDIMMIPIGTPNN